MSNFNTKKFNKSFIFKTISQRLIKIVCQGMQAKIIYKDKLSLTKYLDVC